MKIDKDIPIPVIKRKGSEVGMIRRSRKELSTLVRQMGISDSVLHPNTYNLPNHIFTDNLNTSLRYIGKPLNYKFAIRTTNEGVRFWRIS